METFLWLWLGTIGSALMLELTHPGLFFFLSLSIGGCVALAVLLVGLSLELQIIAFVASAVLAFTFLRAFVTGRKTGTHHKTNVEALIGKKAIVVNRVAYPSSGLVKVHGEVWSARVAEQDILNSGEFVEIVAVVGCHLIVRRLEVV